MADLETLATNVNRKKKIQIFLPGLSEHKQNNLLSFFFSFWDKQAGKCEILWKQLCCYRTPLQVIILKVVNSELPNEWHGWILQLALYFEAAIMSSSHINLSPILKS